jgi:hypothetical protein
MQSTPTTQIYGWRKISEAQRFVPASRTTYYSWIENGLIRSRVIGGARYVDMESLQQMVERSPQRPSTAVRRKMQRRTEASQLKRMEKASGQDQ